MEKIGPTLTAEREARLKKWIGWVETIKHQVYDLHHHRAVWREMRQALLSASPDESTFLEHYARLYTERQLSAVRRLVDPDSRAVSLTRLLTELSEHPEIMTRRLHIELWKVPADPVDVRKCLTKRAHEVFDRYADGDGDNVDPEQVRKDLADWQRTCDKIKKIVNKRIAHFEAADDSSIPAATYADLDKAIDAVGDFIRKYTLLFTAGFIVQMEPTIPSDWKRPFRAPLFEPRYSSLDGPGTGRGPRSEE